MRAAVAHRHAKALGGTEDDIGTLFARCSQQNQRHEVRSNADHHFACFQLGDQLAVIMNFAGGPHLLQQHAENVLMVERFSASSTMTSKPKVAARVRTTSRVCGCTSAATKKRFAFFSLLTRLAIAIASAPAVASSSSEAEAISSPVRSRVTCWKFSSDSVRPWKLPAGKGVSGIPTRIFQHIALNNRRQLHGGITHADVRLEALVATGDRLQFRQRGEFGSRVTHLRGVAS